MNKENVKRRTHLSDGIIIGLLLMAVGCLLLAFNAGLLLPEWKPVIISWPYVGCGDWNFIYLKDGILPD